MFQACGTPPENPNPEEPKKRGKNLAEDVGSTSAASVEKLVCVLSHYDIMYNHNPPCTNLERLVCVEHDSTSEQSEI